MDFTALVIAITITSILAFSFEIVFGIAGTILLIMILGFFIDVRLLVVYSLMPQLLVEVIALGRSPKNIDLKVLSAMLAYGAIGALAGAIAFNILPHDYFKYALSTMITFFGVLLIMTPGKLKLPVAIQRLLDVLAGMSQTLFGMCGPLVMTRLLSTFTDKTMIRNYGLGFFLGVNSYRAIAYAIDGSITLEIAKIMVYSAPFLIIALWNANHLHFKINDKIFRRVIAWVIFIGGISMFMS